MRVSASVAGRHEDWKFAFVGGRSPETGEPQLPPLPSGRAYQLWIVRPGAITSAGLGPAGADAAGRWTRFLDGVRPGDTVAVSVEPLGGSPQPTTTPIVALPTAA